ncbi:MAG: PLP-dependent aminotransferase family protein [Candidatus Rokuibacteriota bacterium]
MTVAAGADESRMISFGAGDAYPEGLPDMGEFARVAASRFRTETLQYAPRPGLLDLREWIVEYLAADGVRVTPQQVAVVNGAKHGLDLVCKLFLEPGDTVVVTTPTYMSALGIFRGWQARYLEIGQDADGMLVDELTERLAALARAGGAIPKLVYDVPEFHNPTGVTLSAARRRVLVALAHRYDMLIVEDDPYRRIRFEGAAVAPIASLDAERVIGLGTFAKLVAPGLRIGWVTASAEILGRMAVLKSDGGTCPLTQRIILEYCRAGRLEPHIAEVARIYAGHRDVMLGALARDLPQAQYRAPHGGYYVWARLPEAVSGDSLAAAAARRGVRVLPASQFYATQGPANYVRVAFSYASPGEIIEGVGRLGEAFKDIA